MDSRLLFLHRCGGGKGGTRQAKLCIPIGHGVSLSQGSRSRQIHSDYAETGRELRRNTRRQSPRHTVRKILVVIEARAPVPKPTQVGEDKYPKVFEITIVKELGNLAP